MQVLLMWFLFIVRLIFIHSFYQSTLTFILGDHRSRVILDMLVSCQ